MTIEEKIYAATGDVFHLIYGGSRKTIESRFYGTNKWQLLYATIKFLTREK